MIDFEAGMESDVEEGHSEYPVAPTSAAALDTRVARYQFDRYQETVENMVIQAGRHVVTDDDSNSHAVAMAGQAKAISGKIEKMRKSLVEEPNQYVKAVNNFAKQYTGKLASIETELKTKINRWQVEQQRARLEAQRKAEAEAKRIQEQIDRESKAAGVDPIQIATPVIPVTTVTRTDNGSASLRKVWTWKLTDFGSVPDEYKVINDKAINQAVRTGIRNIPGVEIFEESQTVIRSANMDMKF
jgi:hypothetical protein